MASYPETVVQSKVTDCRVYVTFGTEGTFGAKPHCPFLTLRLWCYNGYMKKVVIGFGVGLVIGVTSTIIGLRGYANDPLVPLEIREAIPSVIHTMKLALQGSAFIWLGIFFLGLLLVSVNWALTEKRRRKRG